MMNHQLSNNQNENSEMISEDQFRNVFQPQQPQRVCIEVATVAQEKPTTDLTTSEIKKTVNHIKTTSTSSTASTESTVNTKSLADDTTTGTNSPNENESEKSLYLDAKYTRESRFSNTTKTKRTRSRSLPNMTFSHRRYKSQPVSLQDTTWYEKSGKKMKVVSTVNKKSSHGHGHSHRRHHRNLNLSFNGTDSTLTQLPPVNTQTLKEIDLTDILKNPQLRHDILFDPQLQFRPNLDGERGKRKKQIVDKYWSEVEEECKEYVTFASDAQAKALNGTKLPVTIVTSSKLEFHLKYSKLPKLFTSLRDILITLLPSKDRAAVYDVMDIELLVQQLRNGVVDFVSLAKWLSQVFKSHCAPMRDAWVDEMTEKFVEASRETSIKKLIEGLRSIFNILEAMKLDVANHQIRVLRPALVETAVDFERDYFNQMITKRKLNFEESLDWYSTNFEEQLKKDKLTDFDVQTIMAKKPTFSRNVLVNAIIKLLSCREMVTEFPSSLTFDHSRLILLRADVRQLVCLNICLYLYKQLVSLYNKNPAKKMRLLSKKSLDLVKKEILAVITDENGNVKWTRNIPSISVQLAKRCTTDVEDDAEDLKTPPESIVDFANSWLLKQTQPRSDVYGLMEEKVFNQVRGQIIEIIDSNLSKKGGSISFQSLQVPKSMSIGETGSAQNVGTTETVAGTSTSTDSEKSSQLSEEVLSLANRLSVVANFHWLVFGSHYMDAITKEK